jgi:hypothetical protein
VIFVDFDFYDEVETDTVPTLGKAL